MDASQMAELIYEYTSGYPFLVSKLCKLIDEEVAGSEKFPDMQSAWTPAGFWEAHKMLIGEKNTLFESMVNKLYELSELKDIVYAILFTGKEIPYNGLNQAIGTAEMLGFIKNVNGTVVIANKIFEMVFYNLIQIFTKQPCRTKISLYMPGIKNKEIGVKRIALGDKVLIEAVV